MRIAYIGQMADVATENGISKKIRGQTSEWVRRGHAVRYFSLVPTTACWDGLAPLETELVPRGGLGQRFWRSLALAQRVRAWQPDLIYFRYGYHSPGLPALFRAFPTIAEINSDDVTEYPMTLSRGKVMYHRATRRAILGAVTAFVCVTHELSRRFAGFRVPVTVIGNGIALDEFPLPDPSRSSPDDALRLVFVGHTGSPWHGIERVAELARLFPKATIDLVGCTPGDWRACAGGEPPPANLRFHGMLPRDRYEPLLRQANAAIGTMALYRKKMDEACPLKVREYLAMGLPVMAAYQDTDIPDETDYFLRLPNNPSPLAVRRDKVAAWLAHWADRRVPRIAVAHLDNEPKESRRLAFIAEIVRRPSPA